MNHAQLGHYPSFAGTFVNRHQAKRCKMCDDLNIRQNAGVAGPIFTGKNGNGSSLIFCVFWFGDSDLFRISRFGFGTAENG